MSIDTKKVEIDDIREEIEKEVIDKNIIKEIDEPHIKDNNSEKNKKKKHKLWQIEEQNIKINIRRILAYFIIYSFLGFVIETIFGILTKGVVESRQSCLYGPFCCIYGLGAAIMIPGLQKFKKSNWALFIAGAIEGSVVEYVISWLGEIIFQIKWWDYSNMPFNINGRICIVFAIFWGLLALGLMRFINPYIDIMIDKIPKKIFNITTTALTIFLFADLLFTSFGLKIFYTRLIKEYNIELKKETALTVKEEVLENQLIQSLSRNVFTDEKMLKTFPNIKYEDKNGNIIWIKDILTNIQPYYFKISDKFRVK